MPRLRILLRPALILLAVLASLPAAAPLAGQGVTTAAISGRATTVDGAPLASIEVRITNDATGFTRTVLTNDAGTFFVPGLQVGGPYTVQASGLGYETDTRRDLQLALGQNLSLTFVLRTSAVQLEGIVVAVDPTASQVINPNRTGAEQLVTEHQLRNLPTITRNFTDFIQLSPLVGGGGGATSVAQQNNRFNSIQIDGALSQDLFGLGSTGQPGGQAGARSISIEAVREYQVLAAPFDVRQSGFSGGLINAVTKSGTNTWQGSAYFYYKNEGFAREELNDVPFGEFRNPLFGASLGGPLIRDRAHIFVAGEWEDDTRPAGDIAVGREPESVTGISVADADRFVQLLEAKGVEPGSYGARSRENPNRNIFARIDAQLNENNRLTVRHNFVRAEDDIVVNRGTGSSYSLDSNWYFFESSTNSFVAELNSLIGGRFNNELRFGWTRIRDRRSPTTTYPVIRVSVPNAAGGSPKTLFAGAEFFSQGNELDQDSWEITNDLSFSAGNHRITFGIKDEVFKFRNLFLPGKTGEWSFNSLADFENNIPSAFTRNVPYQEGLDPNARFTVNQLSLYGQTEWQARDNLVITAGLRFDLPFVLDEPLYNPAIEQAFGRRTDEVPSGNGILSPRLGFNWDVYGDQTTQVRGGAGIFTGRQPFVWLSNVYSNTGLFTVSVSCSGADLPPFTIDPDQQPDTCLASGTPQPPTAVINLVDPDFKFPHTLRLNAAVDRVLPYGIVGTAELLYSKSMKQILLRELNVDFDNPESITQGGRPVFGTHTEGPLASGANNVNLAQPNRISNAALAVVELGNSDQDRSYSLTLQAQKRYSSGLDLNLAYTYSDAQDLSGLTSSIATSNIGFNPVKGSPNAPELATSDYETTHKIVASGSYDIGQWFTVSLFYVGNSGDKYTYTYNGDVNADGFEASYASNRNNDLVYVPMDQSDITLTDPADWATLDQYIQSEPCLRENRGKIISRNVCKEPWQNRVDARFTFRVPTVRTQRAELMVDVFNVLNLLNEDWGQVKGVPFPTVELLELRGWDTANNRGIFRPVGNLRFDNDGRADPYTLFDPASRWQAQIGIRYAF